MDQCAYPQCILTVTAIPSIYTVHTVVDGNIDRTLIGAIRVNDQIPGSIDPLIEIFQYIERCFNYIGNVALSNGHSILYPATVPRAIMRAQQDLLRVFNSRINITDGEIE